MELNINLLPQPQKKRYDLILVLTLLICTLVVGSILGTITYIHTTEKKESLQTEITKLTELRSITFEKIHKVEGEISESNYLHYWNKLHLFLNNIYLDPYIIITEIKANLPLNARINQLSFKLDGQVTLDGTFNTMGDVAVFLENLLESPKIIDAQVSNINAIETSSTSKIAVIAEGNSRTTRYRGILVLTVQTLGEERND